MGFPLGYIDYYYRLIVIIFTVGSAALLALPQNRTVIKNDYLRIFLALSVLIALFDVASFSFINVWYIGLLPLICLYLSTESLPKKLDLFMGIFGALVALTKPFVILPPIALFRGLRSRQWVGPTIVILAGILQTYQILFNDPRHVAGGVTTSIKVTLGGIFTGSGVELLKLFSIPPTSFWFVIGANCILVALLLCIWRKKGILVSSVLALTYVYAVYTYVLSPDTIVYTGLKNYQEIYFYGYKTQREITINNIILLSLFIVLDIVWSWIISRSHSIKPTFDALPRLFPLLILILLVGIYKPIDTTSASVSTATLEPFRNTLNAGAPVCVPLSPTTYFLLESNWSYAYKGTCITPNHDLNVFQPDFANMVYPANNVLFSIDAIYFRTSTNQLSGIVVPINNLTGTANTLYLEDTLTHSVFATPVKSQAGVQYISFNTKEISKRNSYSFTINQAQQGLAVGLFRGGKGTIGYSYFIAEDH